MTPRNGPVNSNDEFCETHGLFYERRCPECVSGKAPTVSKTATHKCDTDGICNKHSTFFCSKCEQCVQCSMTPISGNANKKKKRCGCDYNGRKSFWCLTHDVYHCNACMTRECLPGDKALAEKQERDDVVFSRPGRIQSICFSRNGKRLFVASHSDYWCMKVWDVNNPTTSFACGNMAETNFAINPFRKIACDQTEELSSRVVIVGSNGSGRMNGSPFHMGKAIIYGIGSEKRAWFKKTEVPFNEDLLFARFHTFTSILVITDRCIRVLSLTPDGKTEECSTYPMNATATVVAVSDSHVLVNKKKTLREGTFYSTDVFDLHSRSWLGTWLKERIHDAALLPHMALVVRNSAPKRIEIYDLMGSPMGVLASIDVPVVKLVTSQKHSLAAAYDTSGYVHVWKCYKDHSSLVVKFKMNGVTALEFTPDGKGLAVGGNDLLFIRDLPSHKKPKPSPVDPKPVEILPVEMEGRLNSCGCPYNGDITFYCTIHKKWYCPSCGTPMGCNECKPERMVSKDVAGISECECFKDGRRVRGITTQCPIHEVYYCSHCHPVCPLCQAKASQAVPKKRPSLIAAVPKNYPLIECQSHGWYCTRCDKRGCPGCSGEHVVWQPAYCDEHKNHYCYRCGMGCHHCGNRRIGVKPEPKYTFHDCGLVKSMCQWHKELFCGQCDKKCPKCEKERLAVEAKVTHSCLNTMLYCASHNIWFCPVCDPHVHCANICGVKGRYYKETDPEDVVFDRQSYEEYITWMAARDDFMDSLTCLLDTWKDFANFAFTAFWVTAADPGDDSEEALEKFMEVETAVNDLKKIAKNLRIDEHDPRDEVVGEDDEDVYDCRPFYVRMVVKEYKSNDLKIPQGYND